MDRLRNAAIILNISLLLIYGNVLYQLRWPLSHGYSDFVSLYTAGEILKRGEANHLYDLHLQYEIQKQVAPAVSTRQSALPFVRPAFEAWVFWPLAHLPYEAAFVVWNLFNCACLILATLCLRREIPGLNNVSPLLLVASGLSYFPVFFTILQGQDSILLLLIYVVSYAALRRDRQFLAGITLGFGIFKFPLLIPFLIPFAVKKRVSVLFGFAVTSLALGTVTVATVGLSTAAYYPKYLLNIDKLAVGVNRAQDMPNIRGLLGTLLRGGLSREMSVLLLVLLSVLLLAYVIRRWSFDSDSERATFALGLALNVVATILVSYHCHAFDLSLLLLPIGLAAGTLLSKEPIAPATRKFLIWLLCLLMFSPLYMWITFNADAPSLLAIPIVAFAFAIGLAIQDLQKTGIGKHSEASSFQS
jgi:hypothetical protein